MEPTKELINALHQDKLEQARAMTEKQRLEAGGELFDYACEITKAGIRHDHPHASEEESLQTSVDGLSCLGGSRRALPKRGPFYGAKQTPNLAISHPPPQTFS